MSARIRVRAVRAPTRVCDRDGRFYKWRQIVVVSLLAGYMGYYFNRSNLSVAQDEIIEKTGVTPTEMSLVLRCGANIAAPPDRCRRPMQFSRSPYGRATRFCGMLPRCCTASAMVSTRSAR